MSDDLVPLLRRATDPLLSDRLHELIGYATVDHDFAIRLLANPRKAAGNFGLSGKDLSAAASVTGAHELPEYAARLEQAFAGLNHPPRVRARQHKAPGPAKARKAS